MTFGNYIFKYHATLYCECLKTKNKKGKQQMEMKWIEILTSDWTFGWVGAFSALLAALGVWVQGRRVRRALARSNDRRFTFYYCLEKGQIIPDDPYALLNYRPIGQYFDESEQAGKVCRKLLQDNPLIVRVMFYDTIRQDWTGVYKRQDFLASFYPDEARASFDK